MIDLKHKKCNENSCNIRPSFGIDFPMHCVRHKTNEMKDLVNKFCIHDNCRINCVFGYINEVPLYCNKHKKENMINLYLNKCKEPNCMTSANFGYTKYEYCSKHKKHDMKDLVHKTCKEINCYIQPVFEYTEIEYCNEHKKQDMINLKILRCNIDNCEIGASFGFKNDTKASFCYKHSQKNMINLRHIECQGCNLLFKSYENHNKYCGYCNPEKQVLRKKKELAVKKLLDKNNLTNYIYDKQVINNCCLKYRPDFLFELDTHYIILECDEDAHCGYAKECELIQMELITSSLNKPVKFIRYNPDLKGISKKNKEIELLKTMIYYLHTLENTEPLYLFY